MKRKILMFRTFVSKNAIQRVVRTLQSGWIGEGPVVQELEQSIMTLVGCPFAIAVNSCTSALHLAIVVSGVGSGDEVITTAQTMMATSHAIIMQGAKPVFADVQYLTGNIDPNDIEHRITDKTKAILIVHWAGYPCDLNEIHTIAGKYDIPVIEDAAHAIGASYKGKSIGSISPFTCFSLQATKHVTSGDGGILCMLNENSYNQARRRRWFGIDRQNRKPSELGEPEWNVKELGYKYQMNDIAASIAVENLKMIDTIFNRRTEVAKRYRAALASISGITLLENKDDRVSANWIFTMHVERRLDFARMMHSKGVDVSVVHLRIDRNDIFGGEGKDLPILDKFTQTHISLPMHNLLTDKEIEYIIKCIKEGW